VKSPETEIPLTRQRHKPSHNNRGGPSGSDSLNNWGIRTSYPFPSYLTGTVSPFTQTRYFAEKWKQGGTAPLIQGWRKPTLFRGYAFRLIPGGAFKYKAFNSVAGTSPVEHYGPMGYSAASTDFYYGSDGTGRYPRTSVNLVNRAEVECMNKIKEGVVNLAESLATLDQTLTMLFKAVVTLRKAISAARKGDWVGANDAIFGFGAQRGWVPRSGRFRRRRAFARWKYTQRRSRREYANGVSSRWLEYIYGWKPLIQDIMGLLALAQGQNKMLPMVTATRRLEESDPLPARLPLSTGRTAELSGERTNGVFVRIDVALSNPGLALLDQLGMLNPAALAWELIPFSFVLDWLIPIGACLNALTASFGTSFKGMSTTTYTRMKAKERWSQYFWPGDGSLISCEIHSKVWNRVIYASMPLPRLYMKSPFTSLTRAATAVALHTNRR
jgi:hypothetical protein